MRRGRGVIPVLFIAILVQSCSGLVRRPPHETVALFVNEQPVSLDEFRWFMEQQRAGVIQYFKASYDLDYGEGFWSRDCGETTPRALLRGNTVRRVVRDKVEQGLFQDLGLVGDIRYATFVSQLEKGNKEREQAVREGRAVYGPVHYSQLQLYGHWQATLRVQAQEKLAREQWGVTDAKLRAYFDQHKPLFQGMDSLTSGMARTSGTDVPYEQVEARVRSRYLEEEYTTEISRRVEKAVVRVNAQIVSSLLP